MENVFYCFNMARWWRKQLARLKLHGFPGYVNFVVLNGFAHRHLKNYGVGQYNWVPLLEDEFIAWWVVLKSIFYPLGIPSVGRPWMAGVWPPFCWQMWTWTESWWKPKVSRVSSVAGLCSSTHQTISLLLWVQWNLSGETLIPYNSVRKQNRELKQTRRRQKRERHLKMWLRVSVIIFQLFKVIMLEKRVLTILELNWNQLLGHKRTKLNICHHMLSSSTQLQNSHFTS